ncbi:MAG TPA: MlaD family protein, partial [Bacteroidia bacterium]|nr:MlaD family protein [Bacteroidia bacterium]
MKKSLRKKTFLGIFVSGGIVLFIIGIFFIGRKEEMYVKTFHVSTIFSDINGLRAGDFVRFAGAKVGIVEGTTFLNDSMIRVDMKIEKDMQPFIMNDCIVYIATEGLVGNKLLNIVPQHKSRTMVAENATLESIDPFNTEQIIEQLLNTNDNAAVITKNLAELSGKMNSSNGIFQSLMGDSSAASDFRQIISNVKLTSDRLTLLSADFQRLTKEINLNESIAGSLFTDTSLANSFAETMENLRESSEYSTVITSALATTLATDTTGTIGVLMRDTAFATSVKTSVKNLE